MNVTPAAGVPASVTVSGPSYAFVPVIVEPPYVASRSTVKAGPVIVIVAPETVASKRVTGSPATWPPRPRATSAAPRPKKSATPDVRTCVTREKCSASFSSSSRASTSTYCGSLQSSSLVNVSTMLDCVPVVPAGRTHASPSTETAILTSPVGRLDSSTA